MFTDSRKLAFENLRGSPGSPQNPDRTDPGQSRSHGFIVVFDYATRSLRYPDPVFATDTNPMWSPDGIAWRIAALT